MWSGEKILEMGTSWRVEVVGNRAGTGWELPVNGEGRHSRSCLSLSHALTKTGRRGGTYVGCIHANISEPYVASVDVWPGLSCRSELLAARWLAKTETNS